MEQLGSAGVVWDLIWNHWWYYGAVSMAIIGFVIGCFCVKEDGDNAFPALFIMPAVFYWVWFLLIPGFILIMLGVYVFDEDARGNVNEAIYDYNLLLWLPILALGGLFCL